jgi:hypothetical protein
MLEDFLKGNHFKVATATVAQWLWGRLWELKGSACCHNGDVPGAWALSICMYEHNVVPPACCQAGRGRPGDRLKKGDGPGPDAERSRGLDRAGSAGCTGADLGDSHQLRKSQG